MALTQGQFLLIELLTDRAITALTALKVVPGMTEEQVDAETKKWKTLSDEEMAELDSH